MDINTVINVVMKLQTGRGRYFINLHYKPGEALIDACFMVPRDWPFA